MSNGNTNSDLRTHLFDALAGIKAGTMDSKSAHAMAEVAQAIINSAKLDLAYTEKTGTRINNSFIECEQTPGRIVHRAK